MSDERRGGIFWMMHWEKRRNFVCWSEMESLREMMHFFYDKDVFGEDFFGKCSIADGVFKEAEAVVEFDRDSRHGCVSRVGSCQECCNCDGNR